MISPRAQRTFHGEIGSVELPVDYTQTHSYFYCFLEVSCFSVWEADGLIWHISCLLWRGTRGRSTRRAGRCANPRRRRVAKQRGLFPPRVSARAWAWAPPSRARCSCACWATKSAASGGGLRRCARCHPAQWRGPRPRQPTASHFSTTSRL